MTTSIPLVPTGRRSERYSRSSRLLSDQDDLEALLPEDSPPPFEDEDNDNSNNNNNNSNNGDGEEDRRNKLSFGSLSLNSVSQYRIVRGLVLLFFAFCIIVAIRFWTPGFPFGMFGQHLAGLGEYSPYLHLPTYIIRNLANYAPYSPLSRYTVPFGCVLTQVHILQRHGARFPTDDADQGIRATLDKLHQNTSAYLDSSYDFMSSYDYTLGTNDLVSYGAIEARIAGRETFLRYGDPFFRDLPVPFIRAAGSQRVIDSAGNWSMAYSVASGGRVFPDSIVLPETRQFNNSLHTSCANTQEDYEPSEKWLKQFATPVAQRFNKVLPGVNLDHHDIRNLISLCGFDSVDKSLESPFCKIFTVSDFINFEYYFDLLEFYTRGYGNKVGPAQGVGYVNELLARLTRSPVNGTVAINQTMAKDPSTFPLDRLIYVDFTHDSQIASIASALGLFTDDFSHTSANNTRPSLTEEQEERQVGEEEGEAEASSPRPSSDLLDPLRPDHRRNWVFSRIAPFSGRIVFEKIECGSNDQYMRILVNDAVRTIKGCQKFYPGHNSNGLCPFDKFVQLQEYSRLDGMGDYDQCKQK